MSQFKNAMEVFKLLEKSNCRKCGEKTCMAFAGSVFMGKMQLDQCPLLSPDIITEYRMQERKTNPIEEDFEQMVEKLKSKLQDIDLATKAKIIGANYESDRLSLKIMGKKLSIDKYGKVYTDIHVNSWIYITILYYIIYCQGLEVSTNWVPLRELPSGKDWYRLFGQQCEKPLKKVADTYPDLFADLVHMFSGKKIDDQFKSDIAVELSPLPLVPMLICYWRPEEGMGSSLNLFFDATAEKNLGMDGVYLLGTGFTRMLEKLVQQHGFVTT